MARLQPLYFKWRLRYYEDPRDNNNVLNLTVQQNGDHWVVQQQKFFIAGSLMSTATLTELDAQAPTAIFQLPAENAACKKEEPPPKYCAAAEVLPLKICPSCSGVGLIEICPSCSGVGLIDK